MMRASKSSPPRNVSPAVATTLKTPPAPISRIEMSNVPPPRSKTAMGPASLVAWRWVSLKYAGTVTTAFETVSWK